MKTSFTFKGLLIYIIVMLPLFSYAAAPVNDNCSGAIAFPTLIPGGGCTSVTVKTDSATQSSAGCSGTADDDVWYSFVVPVGYTAVHFKATSVSGNTDRVFQFYSGACGALTSVLCLNADSGAAANLTPGATYYIRTYTWGNNTHSNFTLCLRLGPVNDNCSGAIAFPALATDGVCTSLDVSTYLATSSSTGCNGTADDDVWYSFVVPAGYTAVHFKAISISGSTDRTFQVYSGACGSLTSVMCLNADSGAAANLTPGATYYLRTHTWGNNTISNFTLCLRLPPANDICSGAIAFPTLTPGGACTSLDVNTYLATSSSTGCNGTADDDVWYSFTVPAGYNAVNFKITSISGNTDRVFQFYSGTCASLTSILCINADSGKVSGLTAGATYFMRAHTWGSTTRSHFSLCLRLPPANDICSGAIAFPTLIPGGACSSVTVSTRYSSQSSAGCNGTADDDVWYSFTVPTGYTAVNFKAISISGNTDRVFQFYSGTCASLTSILCINADSGKVSNLTPGATYYVRAYTWGSGAAVYSNFSLCLRLPPANDICTGAIAFPPLTTDGNCTTETVSTYLASQSSAACSGTADDDVWYSFSIPNGYSSVLFSNSNVSGNTDRVLQFYSGTCPSLTNKLCSDNESGSVTGLTPGTTYYVRAHTWSSGTTTVFDLCLKLPVITGMKESTDNTFSIYPNPASGYVTIKCLPLLIGSTYSLYDAMGRVVMTGEIKGAKTDVVVEQLSNGLYFIHINGRQAPPVKLVKN